MGSVVEVRSPVDVAQLRARLGDADVVQFQEPLTEAGYRSVAALLGDHPLVLLRVYGFDGDLATLRFLRWFPHVRRFSVAGLWHLTDLTPLDQLSAEVEFLDIGETRRPLDLAPVAQFRRLRRLRIVEHRRGLPELLHANPGLRDLSLWRLPVDNVLPVIALPNLQALALTLGSLTNSEWLTQIPTLRYLALRRVRKLSDLTPVTHLPALLWLWLETLTVERLPDFGSSTLLTRADCLGLRHLRHPAALQGLAAAPQLRELLVAAPHLPVDAVVPFVEHPTLECAEIVLGSQQRDRDADDLLRLPPPRPDTQFAAMHELTRIL
ncbi:hypothetical protein [Micromonospora parathelypteridis]|uniref:Leucine-rich repeat domain-containing protein n=1 Tax=Micromonospora parathelypteridis TaxID=1839617 RepID=A0A840VUM1_9ACTN|nr:hypothetical protein [Micromonospora parathelypteridis]MBB5476270.1 hypothetical protein [Micromonospora parathelypteridis]GGO14281.1 hypothetical protein GCM10011576_25170 [Micromonospora parathelypteridis]